MKEDSVMLATETVIETVTELLRPRYMFNSLEYLAMCQKLLAEPGVNRDDLVTHIEGKARVARSTAAAFVKKASAAQIILSEKGVSRSGQQCQKIRLSPDEAERILKILGIDLRERLPPLLVD